jgi:hypothetical protein
MLERRNETKKNATRDIMNTWLNTSRSRERIEREGKEGEQPISLEMSPS